MAVVKDAEQEYKPNKKKPTSDEDDKRSNFTYYTFNLCFVNWVCVLINYCLFRRKKMVPGGLMKAMIRPGGGDAMPSDGDQVLNLLIVLVFG